MLVLTPYPKRDANDDGVCCQILNRGIPRLVEERLGLFGFTGTSGGGVYPDTLAELVYRTGQVLDAVDQAGLLEDAIVVWSSDNPAGRSISTGGSNGPWRGHFGSGFEGGMRAPTIVRWPGKVEADAISDEILTAVDWLPTLASLVGESEQVPTDCVQGRDPRRRWRSAGTWIQVEARVRALDSRRSRLDERAVLPSQRRGSD